VYVCGLQAPARHFPVDGATERRLGTAGASQSFTAAPPGGDELHRMMMQAQGMIQTSAERREGR